MDNRFFAIKNPWRSGQAVKPPAIRRTCLDDLDRWLKDNEVVVIYGPRRVGKSTLLLSIVAELLKSPGISPQDLFFFDLDTLDCSDVLATPAALIDFIGMPQRRTFVLIDEVQRLENPGLFLKGVRDLGLPLKLIVSGSSSLEIRSKVRETLSGRKRILRLGGLDWAEYQAATGPRSSWQEYLTYGSYPAVALEAEIPEKRRLLLEYYESYLDRDADSFLRLNRLDVFRQFIRLLAFQSGSLVNLNELAGTLGAARDTLARYLFHLEETFVVRRLLPFATNPRKEITKMPKVFFADCGLRNLVSAGFPDWEARPDSGALLETAVEHWLRRRHPLAEVRFWRTESQAEVDFVVLDGGRMEAFEVKAQHLRRPALSRSLRSFAAAYAPAQLTVVNLSLEAETTIDRTPVCFRKFPECMA
jgi:predicted AAA+ superfamily ATPase